MLGGGEEAVFPAQHPLCLEKVGRFGVRLTWVCISSSEAEALSER